jgi:hypothetical protein
MVSTRRISRAVVLLACASLLVSLACVPITNTMRLSPTTIGTVQHEDGTPVARRPLLLSVEYNDSTCTKPALHTMTDPDYSICADPADPDPIYEAQFLHKVPAVDLLSCIAAPAAEPGGGQQTQCAASRGQRASERRCRA